jgi:nicotinamide-nucleotide amidase
MKIELIATGEELLDGRVVNSNTRDISALLYGEGWGVERATTVGDHPKKLLDVFSEISQRADIAISTGGLGPTDDDRTSEIVAQLAGVERVQSPEALAQIEAFFEALRRPMADINKKQALLPDGSTILQNHYGTAPGFLMEVNGCRFFALPGVPSEMRGMMRDHVLPRLREWGADEWNPPLLRRFKCFGTGESQIASLLQDLYPLPEDVEIGYRAKFPEVHISVVHRGHDKDASQQQLEALAAQVEKRCQRFIYGQGEDTFVETLGTLLRSQGKTLALAESCTGGLIAQSITEFAGVSDFFLMSAVTYSNEAKQAMLGVTSESLETQGAVSEEVAREMAEGARRVSGADIATSVTGIAGPGGGTPDKPVGTVHIAVADAEGTIHRRLHLAGGRARVQKLTAYAALELVRRRLLGESEQVQFHGEVKKKNS